MMIAAVVIAVLGLVLVLAFLRGADTSSERPRGPRGHDVEPWQRFEPMAGSVDGVDYVVECYSAEIQTVEIDAPGKLSRPLEIDARAAAPELPSDDRAGLLKELLDLDVDFIDVGACTTRVAGEVPFERLTLDRRRAEEIVRRLIALRRLSA